jgi:uncharacterized protein (DUF697 family)
MVRKLKLKHLTTLLFVYDFIEQEKRISHYQTMPREEKQAKANEIIRNHVGFALGAALIPMPGADLLAVSAVQLNMLRQLAKLYNVGFMDTLGKNLISAVVGTSAARIGASLVKAIPGVGTVIGEISMPALSGASTYALGKVVSGHFQHGGSLEDFDFKSGKKGYEEEIAQGKKVAEEMSRKPASTTSPADETLDKVKKLAEMKDAGIITEEEFTTLKQRLLSQL